MTFVRRLRRAKFSSASARARALPPNAARRRMSTCSSFTIRDVFAWRDAARCRDFWLTATPTKLSKKWDRKFCRLSKRLLCSRAFVAPTLSVSWKFSSSNSRSRALTAFKTSRRLGLSTANSAPISKKPAWVTVLKST